jgi:hypothetical protein
MRRAASMRAGDVNPTDAGSAAGLTKRNWSHYSTDPVGAGSRRLPLLIAPSQDWPAPYILKEPRFLPSGTRLSVTAHSADDSTAAGAAAIRPTVGWY